VNDFGQELIFHLAILSYPVALVEYGEHNWSCVLGVNDPCQARHPTIHLMSQRPRLRDDRSFETCARKPAS
jgi:hypothetical protein